MGLQAYATTPQLTTLLLLLVQAPYFLIQSLLWSELHLAATVPSPILLPFFPDFLICVVNPVFLQEVLGNRAHLSEVGLRNPND